MNDVASSPPNILLVDDNPLNLRVLTDMLLQSGWRPRPVTSAALALEVARHEPPNLVLLDVNMPDMNGYELCARLKALPELAEIPVMFVSALGETFDKVRGFQVGGVDYVTKPFHVDEVTARVRVHLELDRQRRALAASYRDLRESERMRDGLVHMIVHDLRSPLGAIAGYLEVIAEEAAPGSQLGADARKARDAAHTMTRMINGILDVSKMEARMMKLEVSECDLVQVVGHSLDELESLVGARHVAFEHPLPPAVVLADQEIVRRIVQNLLANALRLTPTGGEVRIGIVVEAEQTRVFVTDTGPGIAADYQRRIFDKFAQLETTTATRNHTTGLGLAFCKLAVEAHGGRIGVDSEQGSGSTFWFTLPSRPALVE
jgi:two-component system, sensor histidine kinase and response regulator